MKSFIMKHLSNILSLGWMLMLLHACGCGPNGRGPTRNPAAPPHGIGEDTTIAVNQATAVNIYIENSGSMDGYVNGHTQFKDDLRELLVMLKNQYGEERINLYFVNSAIYPTGIQGDLVDIPSKLNSKTIKVGHTASSELNHIFKQVLAKTTQDTLSLLLSDCIYSIQGNETGNLLNAQKSLTKDVFLTKHKNDAIDLSTVIVKLNSAFNGTYYDKNNRKIYLGDGKAVRPYYLVVMGSETVVADFNSKVPLSKEKIADVENKFILSAQDFSKLTYRSVIQTVHDVGSYKPTRNSIVANGLVHGIEKVRVGNRAADPFTFSVAVDLGKIPVEEDYIQDMDSYQVTKGNYELIAIHQYNTKDLKPSSLNLIQRYGMTPTHYLVFQATSKNYTDLAFSLKKRIPAWVHDIHTDDDTDIHGTLNQTFGFRYLVEGMAEAYATVSPSADSYFEIEINIKK